MMVGVGCGEGDDGGEHEEAMEECCGVAAASAEGGGGGDLSESASCLSDTTSCGVIEHTIGVSVTSSSTAAR